MLNEEEMINNKKWAGRYGFIGGVLLVVGLDLIISSHISKNNILISDRLDEVFMKKEDVTE